MMEDKAFVYKLLCLKKAKLFVCGANAIARGVQTTIENIIVQEGKKTIEFAKRYVKELKRTERYVEDVWGD